MIGLDTNVLVWYLTHDDPVQTVKAVKVIDSLTQEAPGFVALIVVVELVWVLETAYQFERKEIEQVLEALLRSKELVVERAEIAWLALRKFSVSRADFSDCLIERIGQAAECLYTATFDRKATGAGMRLIR
jgi:predicted nucleic-acid-binding protein